MTRHAMKAMFVAIAMASPLIPSSSRAQADLADEPSCHEKAAFAKEENVIILDRTTIADSSAKARYKEGVKRILENRQNSGRLTLEEVRDNETQTQKLAAGCLDRLASADDVLPGSSWSARKAHAVTEWVKGLFSPRTDDEDPDRLYSEAVHITEDRATNVRIIAGLIETNSPTDHDTEIAQSLVAIIQSDCGMREACRIFIYSDLLDSEAKHAMRRQEDMEASGRSRAQGLLREYQPRIKDTALAIRAWGFGRADDAAGRPLTDAARRQLRRYWKAFFDVLLSGAAPGSTADISDMFLE